MLNLPTRTEHVIGPLLVATIAILLFVFQSTLYESLVFNRHGISEFELWRLLTGNYLHSNFNHLLLNLLLWSLHGDLFTTRIYLAAFTFFCIFMSLCLYLFTPELSSYVGLSGALHGLFVWGAIKDIKVGYKSGWSLLIGIAIKIGYEQLVGPSEDLAKTIEASIAIDAHLFGALVGLCWACFEHFSSNNTIQTKEN
jgi:rhomboid family GlyGly-CTERM serine protease